QRARDSLQERRRHGERLPHQGRVDGDPVMTGPSRTVRLKAAEGDALRIAELLVGHGRSGPLPPSIDVSAPSDQLQEIVARTIAAGCLEFLLHNGGAKERAILRDGKRKA